MQLATVLTHILLARDGRQAKVPGTNINWAFSRPAGAKNLRDVAASFSTAIFHYAENCVQTPQETTTVADVSAIINFLWTQRTALGMTGVEWAEKLQQWVDPACGVRAQVANCEKGSNPVIPAARPFLWLTSPSFEGLLVGSWARA